MMLKQNFSLLFILALTIFATAIAAQYPIASIFDVAGSCADINRPTCTLQFVGTQHDTMVSVSKTEFFDALNSIDEGACERKNDGFRVKFGSALTVYCNFTKRTNVSIAPFEFYPGVFFPGLTYYYFPTQFTPGPGSSCADADDFRNCEGTLKIPALVQLLTLEVTTPLLSASCGSAAIVQSSRSNPVDTLNLSDIKQIPVNNNAKGNVIMYSYLIVVQEPSVLSIECKLTFLKESVKYTPHFVLIKDDHPVYESNDILTSNVEISFHDDCGFPDNALCKIYIKTPYFADRQSFNVYVPGSLGSYDNAQYDENLSVVGEYSVYHQSWFKPILAVWYQIDTTDAANGNTDLADAFLEAKLLSIALRPSGNYLSNRSYEVNFTPLKYYEIIKISIDEALCQDPSVPFCRVFFTSQYYGKSVRLRLDRLPFDGVYENMVCVDNQMTFSFTPQPMITLSGRSSNSIVQPKFPPRPGSGSNYPLTIQCQMDFALSLKATYPSGSPAPIYITETQDSIDLQRKVWLPFKYLLDYAAPNQLAFHTIPFQFSYDPVTCFDPLNALCQINFTVPYMDSDAIENSYPRSFQFELHGVNNDMIGATLVPEVTISGSSFTTVSASKIVPADPSQQTTIRVEINTPLNLMLASKAASANGVFPYFDAVGQDVVISVKYHMAVDFTMDSSNQPRLTSYNTLPLPTPETLSDASTSDFPVYTPAYQLIAQKDCNTITNAFCTIVFQPTSYLKQSTSFPFVQLGISAESSGVMGIFDHRLVGFSDCSRIAPMIGGGSLINYVCTFSPGHSKNDNAQISFAKRLLAQATDTTFHLTFFSSRDAVSGEAVRQDVTFLGTRTPVQYQGDAYPTYRDDCGQANAPSCVVDFTITTFPVFPSTTILKYQTFYQDSFRTYTIASCEGADGATPGSVISPGTLADYFTYSIDQDGMLTFSLNNTLPSGLTSLTSDAGAIKCQVVHYKNLQDGFLPHRITPLIVMGIDFIKDYSSYPPATSFAVRVPFTTIRYHPISAVMQDNCRDISAKAIDCTTRVTFYGTKQYPIQSLVGDLDDNFLNKSRHIALLLGTLVIYQEQLSQLPIGVKILFIETSEYKLWMLNTGTFLGWYTEYPLITDAGERAATYNLYIQFNPLPALKYEILVEPKFQETTFSCLYIFLYELPPDLVAYANLSAQGVVALTGKYPGVMNGVTDPQSQPPNWFIAPVALGTPLQVKFASEHRRVPGNTEVPITYRFSNPIASMHVDSQLWGKTAQAKECVVTEAFTTRDNRTFNVGDVIGVFDWNESRQMTRFTPKDALDTTDTTCTVPLLVSNRFPSNWYQVDHLILFAEEQSLEFIAPQNYPEHGTSAKTTVTTGNANETEAESSSSSTPSTLFALIVVSVIAIVV